MKAVAIENPAWSVLVENTARPVLLTRTPLGLFQPFAIRHETGKEQSRPKGQNDVRVRGVAVILA